MVIKLPHIRILGHDLYWSKLSHTVYWSGPTEGYAWLLAMDFFSIIGAQRLELERAA